MQSIITNCIYWIS